MVKCAVCGNESDGDMAACPFCGADLQGVGAEKRTPQVVQRTVNLKQGRPLVDTAVKRMTNELAQATAQNVKVLILIHGYGSSGKGGKIREECRKVLDDWFRQRRLRQVIPGEQFQRRHGPGKALLRRFPHLETECPTVFNNPGVTITVL